MLSSLSRFMRPVALGLVLVSCASEGLLAPAPPSPSSAVSGPVATHLVINEIMADPAKVTDNLGEWFELYNPTATAIDLKGWSFKSNNDNTVFTITAALSVPAGGYLVCARNTDAGTNGGITTGCSYANPLPTSSATINLANAADWLVVRDKTGAMVDSVAYTSTKTGVSRALLDPAVEHANVNGTDWTNSTSTYGLGDKGTPGVANDAGVPNPPGVVAVAVSPSTASVLVGVTKQFTASEKDANGSAIVNASYTWSSSDATVATVDANGLATALKAGTATITATAPDAVAGTAKLTVTSPIVSNAVYRNSVDFGTPTDGDASDDYIITRPQYTISYNKNRDDPNWVAWNLNATQIGAAQRCDCFNPDPALPSDIYHVVTSDYTGGGYDRGHMSPSGDRTASDADNAVTFYMTNMLPQYHNLNAGPWEDLETYSRSLVTGQNKELYIVSGGIFPSSPQTINGAGKIQIPTSTWKIVVIVNAGQGLADVHSTKDLQVIAVNMPNTLAVPITDNWQKYTTTVDAIEAATGYNFLSALPDSIQKIVEANDHPPVTTLTVQSATTVAFGQPVSVTGKFTDPDGRGDAPWSYVFNWGDGTITKGIQLSYPSDLTQFTRSKTYANPGTYTVRFTVTDKYGAGGYTEVPVTVQP